MESIESVRLLQLSNSRQTIDGVSRFGQLSDLLFECGDEWFVLWYFHSIVTLFMLAKQKQVSFILRSIAVKVELILGDRQLANLLRLHGSAGR